MAWTTPMTAVAGAFTAAQWNTHVRDNLLETAPAIASGNNGPYWFVADGVNSIVARRFATDHVPTEQTRSSTSYGNLATTGPSVTLTTGSTVIVMISARIGNDTASSATQATFTVSGASSISADDSRMISTDGLSAASAADNLRTVATAVALTVTPGTNTFRMVYKCTSGTGRFSCRTISVWSF